MAVVAVEAKWATVTNRPMDGFMYLARRVDTYAGINCGPATLHRYLYAHSDPLNRIDPSGNVATTTVEAAQVNTLVSAIVNISAYLVLKEVLPRIKEKIDEDSGLFIYRRGNPSSLKTTALYRESDWKSGLSFSTKRPAEKHLKFRVINLLIAGFAVFPDGGREFSNIIEGGPLDDRIAGPDHVSVFLPDRIRWDAWYNSEKDNTTQNPFVPNSRETSALYALSELNLPW